MDRARKRELRIRNARAWAGERDVFPISDSLDTSLKKNTAFIKRLRTGLTAAAESSCLTELRTLSLHKYLSEVISASYEGLCRCKTPAEVSSGVTVISGLHQRFGPAEFTSYLGWWLGRGLTTPDKVALKNWSAEAREKEEKERLARQRILLKVVTELWLVGVLRSLEDVARPEDANAKGKENAGPQAGKLGEALKGKPKNVDTEAFPLEVLKDLLGHDREHANLPLVVVFVKSFAWDVLGIGEKSRQTIEADGAVKESKEEAETAKMTEDWADEVEEAVANDPPLTSPELQQRFKGILNRYLEDVKQHVVRDQRAVATQAKKNAEIYVKSGEVFEDRQANYTKQLKAQERLVANAQILCEYLGSEMPELQEKEEAEATGGSIGLVKAGEYLRGQGEGAGIWEDEDERRFYENLVDLKDRVPGILLEEPKKKKDEEQVGKKADGDSKEEKAESTDEQSMAIANKTVGAQVDALLLRLPEMQTKDAADQIAIDFCFFNSKASRNRLLKTLEDVPKGRSDLYPLYSRLAATLGRYLPDVTQGLVAYLDDEFRSLQRRKQKDFLGQVRTGNIRYLAELTKFGVVPEHVIFHCLKVSLDDFSRMNIEIIANLMENCGRYLLRNPETSPRMKSFLETLQRKKAAHHLGQQERMLVENAVYYVNPPERAAIEQKERTPVELYVRKLIYLDMNKRTYTKVLKSIRKLHWEEPEVVALLKKIFSRPGKVKYSSIHLLAILVGALYRYHQDFVVCMLDDLMESITLGLEQNDFKFNQRRIAEVKYLGELYNYKMVDSPVIFATLYRIVGFGHPNGTPMAGHFNPLDSPDDYFRIRLVCNILDTCGTCFDRGVAKKKLDFFLHLFQYYIRTKAPMPMDIEFIVQDSFALVRPQWTMAPDLEEAGRLFAEACAEAYKSNEVEKPAEVDEPEDDASSDDAEDDPAEADVEVEGEAEDGQGTTSEDEEPEDKHDSDFEQDIVVTRQQETAADPEADAEFDRELAKLMAESNDVRTVRDRKPLFDVPLPVRSSKKDTEEEETPNTMAFSLMTKKGNRAQTRTIALPSDSTFAVAMRSRQEAERAEQQRIKSLVLNYDLGDGDHDGLGDRHEPNASIRQAANHGTHRPGERGGHGGHRGQQRSRKLQLSDVDWT